MRTNISLIFIIIGLHALGLYAQETPSTLGEYFKQMFPKAKPGTSVTLKTTDGNITRQFKFLGIENGDVWLEDTIKVKLEDLTIYQKMLVSPDLSKVKLISRKENGKTVVPPDDLDAIGLGNASSMKFSKRTKIKVGDKEMEALEFVADGSGIGRKAILIPELPFSIYSIEALTPENKILVFKRIIEK